MITRNIRIYLISFFISFFFCINLTGISHDEIVDTSLVSPFVQVSPQLLNESTICILHLTFLSNYIVNLSVAQKNEEFLTNHLSSHNKNGFLWDLYTFPNFRKHLMASSLLEVMRPLSGVLSVLKWDTLSLLI